MKIDRQREGEEKKIVIENEGKKELKNGIEGDRQIEREKRNVCV